MRSSIALLLLAALGCATKPVASGPGVGERFSMRRGESVAVRGTRMTLSFEGIVADSRCAIDVVCIQAGEARAAFRRLGAGRDPGEAFELDTARNTSTVLGAWRVTLLSVSPSPRSTVRIAPGDYVVELSVGSEPLAAR